MTILNARIQTHHDCHISVNKQQAEHKLVQALSPRDDID